jgi:hypothetical protein
MNKVILKFSCAILLAAVTFSVQAQGEHKGTIKTNLFGWFGGQYQLGYEHVLNENMTVQLSVGILNGSSSSSYSNLDSISLYSYAYEQDKSGLILIPEFRYYPNPSSSYMEGMYFAGFGRFRLSNWDLTDTGDEGPFGDVSREEKRTVLSAGAVIGYSYYLSNGFNVEIFAGPQFKTVSSTRVYDDATVGDQDFNSKFLDFSLAGLENDGVGLRFGVNIGFGL